MVGEGRGEEERAGIRREKEGNIFSRFLYFASVESALYVTGSVRFFKISRKSFEREINFLWFSVYIFSPFFFGFFLA